MRHYLSYIEDVVKGGWDKPAITNYGGSSYKNCDIAKNIEKNLQFSLILLLTFL